MGENKNRKRGPGGGATLRIADRPSAKGGVTDVTVGNGRVFGMIVHDGSVRCRSEVGVDGDVCHIES